MATVFDMGWKKSVCLNLVVSLGLCFKSLHTWFRLPSVTQTELLLNFISRPAFQSLCVHPYQFTTFFENSIQKNRKKKVITKSNSNYFPVLISEYLVAIITNDFISGSIILSSMNMKSCQEYKFDQTQLMVIFLLCIPHIF